MLKQQYVTCGHERPIPPAGGIAPKKHREASLAEQKPLAFQSVMSICIGFAGHSPLSKTTALVIDLFRTRIPPGLLTPYVLVLKKKHPSPGLTFLSPISAIARAVRIASQIRNKQAVGKR